MNRLLKDLRDQIRGRFFDPFHVMDVISDYDIDYQNVLIYAAEQGYTLPSPETQSLDNAQIVSLKSTGVWDLLDVFYEFATDGDSDFATINWKSPGNFSCLKVNSPAHALGGFTGGGASYLNTQWNPLDNGFNYQQDSASMGFYAQNTLNTSVIEFGGRNNPFANAAYELNGNIGYLNQGTASGFAANLTRGLRVLNRGSSTILSRIINGASTNSSVSSTGLTSSDFYVLAVNATFPTGYSNNEISMAFTGGDLTGKQTDFYNTIQARMTALGIAV